MVSSRLALTAFSILIAAAAFTGCSDDNPTGTSDGTKTFTVTIENVATAFAHALSGAFDTPVGAGGPAAIGPGEAYEFRVGAAPGSKLSLATMFVHSNDLFYAPDGGGIALFDGLDMPLSGDVTGQIHLWDAGTEMNESPGEGPNQPVQGGPGTGDDDANTAVRLVSDGFTYPAVADVIAVTVTHEGGNEFTVRVENVSDENTLQLAGGGSTSVPLAPGVFVVHTTDDPLFAAGSAEPGDGLEALAEDGDPSGLATALATESGLFTPLAPGVFAVHASGMPLYASGAADAGNGLEALAEDGDPAGLAAHVDGLTSVSASGVFSVPVGGAGPGVILPGDSYEFEFTAEDGDRLSLATMFVQSNDLFYGFSPEGLALFDGSGMAVTGDVTAMVDLWDAGSEANQWPGAGPDQAPRQAGADTGAADPNGNVRMVADGYDYPATSVIVRVTIAVAD